MSAQNDIRSIIARQTALFKQKSDSGVRLDKEELECFSILVNAEVKSRPTKDSGPPKKRPFPGTRYTLSDEKLLDYAETETEGSS